MSNQPQPRQPIPTAFSLLLILPLLYWVKSTGITDFGLFGIHPNYNNQQLAALLILFALTYVSLRVFAPEKHVKIRLAGGLLAGLCAFPTLLAPLLLVLSLVHRLLHYPWPNMRLRWAAFFTVFSALGLAAWFDPSNLSRESAELVVALVFFRCCQYIVEQQRTQFKAQPLVDFLAYQLTIPTAIIHPYLAIIPRFSTTQHKHGDGPVARSGVRLIWMSFITLMAAKFIYFGQMQLFPQAPETPWMVQLWSMADMLVVLTYASANAGFCVGLYRLLGQDVRPAFNAPWLSKNLFDYWNRFIIHYKDLQVTLIYFPTVLSQSKRGQVPAILLGVAATFMVGNNLFHLWGRYLYTPDLLDRMPHAILQNVALTVVMGLALWWENSKANARMAGKPHPKTLPEALSKGLNLVFTLAVVSWIWHL